MNAKTENPRILLRRSAGVLAERPHRALEVTLSAWHGQPEIREPFRHAVEAVAGGEDPMAFARRRLQHGRANVVARILTHVAGRMDAGRAEAAYARAWVLRWRGLDLRSADDLTTLAEREQRATVRAQHLVMVSEAISSLIEVELGEPDRLAFKNACGQARAVVVAWDEIGPKGNPSTLRAMSSIVPWSVGAIALGRRFAGACLECGAPVIDDRAVSVAHQSGEGVERRVRRDHCETCERRLSLKAREKTTRTQEKAIERLVTQLSAAFGQLDAASSVAGAICGRKADRDHFL